MYIYVYIYIYIYIYILYIVIWGLIFVIKFNVTQIFN